MEVKNRTPFRNGRGIEYSAAVVWLSFFLFTVHNSIIHMKSEV